MRPGCCSAYVAAVHPPSEMPSSAARSTPTAVEHGVQIELPSLFGKVARKSIRQTHPATVVTNDRVTLRQPFPRTA